MKVVVMRGNNKQAESEPSPLDLWNQAKADSNLFTMMDHLGGNRHFNDCPAAYLADLSRTLLDRAKSDVDGLIGETYGVILAAAAANVMRCQAHLELILRKQFFGYSDSAQIEGALKAWEQCVLFYQTVCAKYASLRHTLALSGPQKPSGSEAGPSVRKSQKAAVSRTKPDLTSGGVSADSSRQPSVNQPPIEPLNEPPPEKPLEESELEVVS